MNMAFKAINWWNLSLKSPHHYRSVIDCTEFHVEKPSSNKFNQMLFSNYKNNTTFKLLVGVDENGFVNYISDLYNGGISDRRIVEVSGFLDFIEEGDAILADKGFTITDLLALKGATLNLPPFLHGQKQYDESEVLEGKILSNRRIIVENVIGRARKMTILCNIVPHHLNEVFDYVVYNIFCLVNFQAPLKNITKNDGEKIIVNENKRKRDSDKLRNELLNEISLLEFEK